MLLGGGGLMPQQQPWSYRGGDDDVEVPVSLVEETGVPGEQGGMDK